MLIHTVLKITLVASIFFISKETSSVAVAHCNSIWLGFRGSWVPTAAPPVTFDPRMAQKYQKNNLKILSHGNVQHIPDYILFRLITQISIMSFW